MDSMELIIIITIAAAWFLTKKYYTRHEEKTLIDSDLIKTQCWHCSKTFYTTSEHQRVVNLCTSCK